MDNLKDLKALFDQRKFHHVALSLDVLLKENPSFINHENLEMLFIAKKEIHDKNYWLYFNRYCQFLIDQKKWNEALSEIMKERDYYPHFYSENIDKFLFLIYFNLGLLEKSRAHAIFHLEKLLIKKNLPQCSIYIELYSSHFLYSWYFIFLQMQYHLLRYDVFALREIVLKFSYDIIHNFKKFHDSSNLTRLDLFQKMFDLFDLNYLSSGEFILLRDYIYLNIIDLSDISLEKVHYKRMMELLIYSDTFDNLSLVASILLKKKHADNQVVKDLLHNLVSYAKSKKNFSLVNFTRSRPWIKEEIGSYKIKNIFLQKVLPVEEFTNSLIRHHVVGKVTQLEKDQDDSILLDSVLEGDSHDFVMLENNQINQLKHFDLNRENYIDFVVNYQMMRLYKVAREILIQVKKLLVTEDDFSRYNYLNVMNEIFLENFYLALIYVEEMLMDTNIGTDKYLELKYTQGYLYKKINKNNEAYFCFMEVLKINKNYRRVRDWIKSVSSS